MSQLQDRSAKSYFRKHLAPVSFFPSIGPLGAGLIRALGLGILCGGHWTLKASLQIDHDAPAWRGTRGYLQTGVGRAQGIS